MVLVMEVWWVEVMTSGVKSRFRVCAIVVICDTGNWEMVIHGF